MTSDSVEGFMTILDHFEQEEPTMDDVAEIQWRITWFPPEVAARTRTGTRAVIKAIVAEDAGNWNPIIEIRPVGEWRVVPLWMVDEPVLTD